jgi:acetylornithine deacetylase
VQALRAAAARTLGAEPEIVGHSAWMDAAFLSAAGIPTVVFGPSGEGAHAVEEHVELESVEQVAEIVLETARRLCA